METLLVNFIFGNRTGLESAKYAPRNGFPHTRSVVSHSLRPRKPSKQIFSDHVTTVRVTKRLSEKGMLGHSRTMTIHRCWLMLPIVTMLLGRAMLRAEQPADSLRLRKEAPVSIGHLARKQNAPISIHEVTNYVFGKYEGSLPSPPHADNNPRRAFIITWKNFPFRFVFAHEGSYCPWFEFPSGAGHCFQFFEGNDGWAELFNNYGRKEENSFIDLIETGTKRVWVRWIYFGVNQHTGQRAYRAVEDFWAFPNGHILRKQTFESLMPGDHRGYAREPIEMIGMCPKGQLWFDILRQESATDEYHALAVLDAFSKNRYDVFWKREVGLLYKSSARRSGNPWQALDDSPGVALVTPLKEGAVFCVLGDASGFNHDVTRIKEHSFKDTGGLGWGSQSWDHWPVGWLNSQANEVNFESLLKYPNHFSPAGMDLFALPNEEVERREFYSLLGVGGKDLETIRTISRDWLKSQETKRKSPIDLVERLPKTFR